MSVTHPVDDEAVVPQSCNREPYIVLFLSFCKRFFVLFCFSFNLFHKLKTNRPEAGGKPGGYTFKYQINVLFLLVFLFVVFASIIKDEIYFLEVN